MRNLGSKVLRAVLVLMILLLSIRGFMSLLNSPTEKTVENALIKAQDVLNDSLRETVEVRNIAELISMEFLTYSKQDETYSGRMNAFGFPVDVDSLTLKSSAVARSAKSYDVEKLNETQYNVSVQVLVDYPNEGISQMMSLVVPVYMDTETLRLDGLVLIQKNPVIDMTKPISFPLKSLEDEILSKEIVLQTENFLKNYYEGTQSELSVYLVDAQNTRISALEGRVQLLPKKTEISVYALDGGRYLSLVDAKVTDTNGAEISQKLQVIVEKRNDKYLIESVSPRTQNISEQHNIKEDH